MSVDLNALAARVHEANKRWWVDLHTGEMLDRNVGEMFMLVVSELAEAMEGHRKNLMDDKLPHRKMAEVELADTLIRLLDLAGSPVYYVNLNGGHRYRFRWSDNFASNLFQIVRVVASEHRLYVTASQVTILTAVHGVIELAARYPEFDLFAAVEEKLAYNATRADHTREGRLAEGGKQY